MARRGIITDVVQKRVPENPKYKNVRPRVDSGASIRRYMERIQESQRNIKQRNDEVFKRIKVTSFVKLIIEVFNETLLSQRIEQTLNVPCRKSKLLNKDVQSKEVCKQTTLNPLELRRNANNRESNVRSGSENVFSNNGKTCNNLNINMFSDASPRRAESVTSISTARSTLHSVITGTGEMDVKLSHNNVPSGISQNTAREPYLLLDVRDSDAYQQCHIITAKNYPHSMLIRTCNYETKDMLACKNAKDRIIIIYDEDESIAPRVATTLVQREYNNIFMLSGGLKLAFYRFPEGLIEGVPPISCQQESSATQNNTMNGLIIQVETATRPASKNCFTVNNMQALQVRLEKCLTVETLSLESRSAQSLVRKSSYHHQLIPHNSKGRIIPWK